VKCFHRVFHLVSSIRCVCLRARVGRGFYLLIHNMLLLVQRTGQSIYFQYAMFLFSVEAFLGSPTRKKKEERNAIDILRVSCCHVASIYHAILCLFFIKFPHPPEQAPSRYSLDRDQKFVSLW
jgi:hypothetical protein